MKKLFHLLSLSILTITSAYAIQYLDQAEVCYEFLGETMISRGVCVVSAQSGAGGGSFGLLYKDKEYLFEYTEGEPFDVYYRTTRYDTVLPDEEAKFLEINEEYLFCFKHKPYDLCFTH